MLQHTTHVVKNAVKANSTSFIRGVFLQTNMAHDAPVVAGAVSGSNALLPFVLIREEKSFILRCTNQKLS